MVTVNVAAEVVGGYNIREQGLYANSALILALECSQSQQFPDTGRELPFACWRTLFFGYQRQGRGKE